MPELAEIETVHQRLKRHFLGKNIAEVGVDNNDRYLFAFAKSLDVKKALLGAKVTGTGRKGKYFWIELNRKPWPMLHLGMSGNWVFSDPRKKTAEQGGWGGVNLRLHKTKSGGPGSVPAFTRLYLRTKDGVEAALTDPRRFGRLWLTDDPWNHPRIKKLGFDPLIDFPPAVLLAERLKKRNKAIKAVLLDQNLFAGIGNWLADEILYQSRVSPHVKASSLSLAQVAEIHKQTLTVVRKAVKVEADHEKFPQSWIFHHRWGKVSGSKTDRGNILHEVVGGRTTAWVPDWQK